jgi:hypothetical protein
MDAIDFGNDLILDPSCGRGNILDVAKRRGHPTVGLDLFDRVCPFHESPVSSRHSFARGDFFRLANAPRTGGRALSIVNNPPYSYKSNICERYIRKALDLPIRRAAFLVPIAFACAEERWAFFELELRPRFFAVLSERPSCPPGSTVTRYTSFKGGMGDYIWLIYEPPHQRATETIWLRPSKITDPGRSGPR